MIAEGERKTEGRKADDLGHHRKDEPDSHVGDGLYGRHATRLARGRPDRGGTHHAATSGAFVLSSANLQPSSARCAVLPVKSCQRLTATST